jgi:hypothetical protein
MRPAAWRLLLERRLGMGPGLHERNPTMKRPEDYLGEARHRLKAIDQRVDELELRIKSAAIEGGMRTRAALDDLRRKRAEVAGRIQDAREEGVEYWKRIRLDLDGLWKDVGEAFSSVTDELAAKEKGREEVGASEQK